MKGKMMQRGRPSKRSNLEIILEREFLADFGKRKLPVNKVAVHLFGWAVAKVEKIADSEKADARVCRLVSDFAAFCEATGFRRSWRNALAWYVKKG